MSDDVQMDVDVLYWACQHFLNLDRANAAIHTALVRYSPITFRLVRLLVALDGDFRNSDTIHDVMVHDGQKEDPDAEA